MLENNQTKNLEKWELVNFCEFDPYAVKSYCAIHNVDESLNLGDITKVDETKLNQFNMIVGGSPCQDFSVAGKQNGSIWICTKCDHRYNPLTVHYSERDCCPVCKSKELDKSRSSLLVEWLRVIRANKPNFGIYENVKNIVGKQFKETTFKLFEEELNEYGYNTYWKVLNAKDYGIPQNRERVYLILIKKELDNCKFMFPLGFDNGVRLKDILEEEVDEKFYISDDKVSRFITNLNNKDALLYDSCQIKREGKEREYNEYCPTLNARDYKDPRIINDNVVKQVGTISECKGNWNNPQVGRIYSSGGISPTLNTCSGGSHEPKIVQIGKLNSSQDGVVVSENGISPTHTAGHGNQPKVLRVGNINPSGNGMNGNIFSENGLAPTITTNKGEGNKILRGIRIRKLTPKECFRLMGFADEQFKAAEKVVSNSQLYKQAGNSIVVDVLYYILVELYKAMPYLFKNLKLGSYFSGIGAFEIALDRLYDYINSGVKEVNFTQPQVD